MFTFPFGFYNSEEATAESMSLWAWGDNAFGQIGDGTVNAATNPNVGLTLANASGDWSKVSCGASYAIALKSDGTLWGWGCDTYGELFGSKIVASPILLSSESWSMISAGVNTVLGIKTDGTLWGWGYNTNGQVGDSTTTARSSPVQIGSESDWTSVSIYSNHALALRSGGTMWSWGNLPSTSSPVQVQSSLVWTAISAGNGYSLAVGNSGRCYRWGVNGSGQLGSGNTANINTPTQLGTLTDYTGVFAGNATAYYRRGGSLWVAGRQMVGNNTTNSYTSPVQVTNLTTATDIVCARVPGTGTNNAAVFTSFSGGSYFLTHVGGVVTSGPTLHGFVSSSNITNVGLGGTGMWRVAEGVGVGHFFTAAISASGDLYTTGINNLGQLGNAASKYSPVAVGSDTDWVKLSSAGALAGAVKANGTLWTWGDGSLGVTGAGSTANRSVPTQVGALTNWADVSLSPYNAAAIKSDGTLWTWGSGASGGLGDGTLVSKSSPVQVGTLTTWAKVAAGRNYGMAVTTGGGLRGWGYGGFGNIGNFGLSNYSNPVSVGALTNWSKIYCSEYTTYSIKTDGTLWAWGRNTSGEVGDGTTTSRSSPVQIGSGTDWLEVATSNGVGGNYVLALKVGGSLWAWGANSHGQLGVGDTIGYSSPVQVGVGTEWIGIAVNGVDTAPDVLDAAISYALKSDGTLWGWGYNKTGMLLDGTFENRSSPVQIGSESDWKSIKGNNGLMMALRSS